MNKKKAEMLYMLLKCREPVALSDLQALSSFESSIRTIRSDVNFISDFLQENKLPGLTVHRDGKVEFPGDEQQRQFALHVLLNQMDYYKYRLNAQERARVLTCCMIWADGYVNHRELCAEVYVSRGTLYTDMRRCAEIAAEYGLTLSSAPSKGYILEGAEWDKRRALYRLQRRWSEKDEASYSDYKYILNQLEERENFVFTDRGYLEILRYIEISLERMRSGHMLHDIPQTGDCRSIPLRECKGGAFVWEHLSTKFALIPTSEEIIALEIYLRVSGRVAARRKVMPAGLSAALEAYFAEISRKMRPVQCPQEAYAELSMFLGSLQFGSNEEYMPNAAILQSLESEYPGIGRNVSAAMPILEAWLGRKLSQGEYYQMTLFTSAVLRYSQPVQRIQRVLLVCDGGPGKVEYLRAQLKQLASVEVIGVTAAHAVARFNPMEVDLVISTVPLDHGQVPFVQVPPVLTRADVKRILGSVLDNICCVSEDAPEEHMEIAETPKNPAEGG